MSENTRLTEKTIGCFKYDLANFEHKVRDFADYDAFFAYNMAVKKLGEYEDTGLSPEEIFNLQAENARLKESSLDAIEMAKIAIALKENARLKAENEAAMADIDITQYCFLCVNAINNGGKCSGGAKCKFGVIHNFSWKWRGIGHSGEANGMIESR